MSASGFRNGRHTKPERTARGERVATAKLDAEKVRKIRRYYPSWRVKDLASLYSVSPGLIRRVLRRETWRHID